MVYRWLSFRPIVVLLLTMACLWPLGKAFASGPYCTSELLKAPMTANIHYVNGKPILLLAGSIEADSDKVVAPDIAKTKSYTEVWLCSGGGSVSAGKAIGVALNKVSATVRAPSNYFCASACTIAFMGGYVRIIDPKAQFVTHASSSAKGFGIAKQTASAKSYTYFAFYDCSQSFAKEHCKNLREVISKIDSKKKLLCENIKSVMALGSNCMYYSSERAIRGGNIIFANSYLTNFLFSNPQLVYDSIDLQRKENVTGEIELLLYFQTMLLDGQSTHINKTAYAAMLQKFNPTHIYKLPKTNEYYRDFESDYKALNDARGKERATYAIWQAMLTDSELSVKAQLSEHVQKYKVDLGLGAGAAIKIYDSMRTCQIQSSCRLEPHSAFALGYHNIAGAQ